MFSIIVKQGIRNSSFWRIWSFVLILKTNRLKLSNYKFVHHKRTLNLESVNSGEAQTFVQVVQNAARWMVNISTVIVAAVRINKRWKTLDPITRDAILPIFERSSLSIANPPIFSSRYPATNVNFIDRHFRRGWKMRYRCICRGKKQRDSFYFE